MRLRDAPRAAARRGQLRGAERRPRAARRARRSRTPSRTRERIEEAQRKTGYREGRTYGTATIGGKPLVVAGIDFGFIGGSMGSAVGRGDHPRRGAGARAADAAARDLGLRRRAHAGGLRLADADGEDEPAIGAAARGGRPLHLAADRPDLRRRERLVRDARRRADRRAATRYIGFAGPEGDRADDPPEAARGLPDRGVPARARDARPGRAAREPAARRSRKLLELHTPAEAATRRATLPDGRGRRADHRSGRARRRATAWDVVQLARNIERPHTLEYVGYVFDDFQELHGDRLFDEDAAIVGGVGAARRPARWCVDRPPEGPHDERDDGAQLRDAGARGLPQGDAPDAATRRSSACRSSRFVDTPGAYPGHRRRGARPVDRDRRVDHEDVAAARPDRHASSPARAAAAARSRSPSATGC